MSLGALILIAALALVAVFLFGRRTGRRSVKPVVLPPVVVGITTTIARSEAPERPTPPHPRASKKLSAREEAFIKEAMKRPRVDIGSNTAPALDVVGESYHQEELHKIAGDRLANGGTVVFTALIVPEPANPYDPNSILVIADGVGPIGHLPREHAVEYSGVAKYLLSREAVGFCEGWLTGGIPDRAPMIGAMLCIDDAPALDVGIVWRGRPLCFELPAWSHSGTEAHSGQHSCRSYYAERIGNPRRGPPRGCGRAPGLDDAGMMPIGPWSADAGSGSSGVAG